MAVITSRQGLIDYALRRLGEPVIEVNVDEDQIEDKVDDALQVYQEFHSDATFRTYFETQITQDNLDNKYIEIPANIIYVTKMMRTGGSMYTGGGWMGFPYQMRLNDMYGATCGGNHWYGGLNYMVQMGQYLNLIDMMINGYPLTTFSRRQNRLYIWSDIEDGQLKVGNYVAIECYQTVDPNQFTSVYNDMFMKDFTTALIKEQWGQNMSKFEGMQLPGGVTISGRTILEEAKQEINDLRERMRLEQEVPPEFFVG